VKWPIILCLALTGCLASGGPDYEVIGRELELAGADLVELQGLAQQNDPEMAKIFGTLGEVVTSVKAAVAAGEGSDGVIAAVQVGLAATENILLQVAELDDKEQTRVTVAVFVVRAILRRVEAYS
jgi:hypothetical protein